MIIIPPGLNAEKSFSWILLKQYLRNFETNDFPFKVLFILTIKRIPYG